MSGRTPGGIFLPDEDAVELLRSAKSGPCTEPTPFPTGSVTIDSGWASSFFVTDPGAWVAELDDALVLVSSVAVESSKLVALLEEVARAARPILIAAPSLSEDALGMLVVNKLRGVLYVNAIVCAQPEQLANDIGCKAHDALEALSIADLGKTKRAISGAKTTVIATSAIDRL